MTTSCPNVFDRTKLQFLFRKKLQMSDVGHFNRMVIPKKYAEAYLPPLKEKDGVILNVHDLDIFHVWNFKFRFWINNTSRMYVLENIGEFLDTHKLKQGDFVVMYGDVQNHCYVITTTKASTHDFDTDSFIIAKASGSNDKTAPSFFPTCDDDWIMNFSLNDGPFSIDFSRSYVYDTTKLLNDTVFDFWTGPAAYISRPGHFGCLESIENTSEAEILLSLESMH